MIARAVHFFSVAAALSHVLMAVDGLQDAANAIPEEGRQKYALRAAARSSQPHSDVSAAVAGGLLWLKTHQDENGQWQAERFMRHDRTGTPTDGAGHVGHDCGISGLALLAFLGDGQTPTSGEFADTVRRGVAWLCSLQERNGRFGANMFADTVYDHVIATLAVTEAYGLSGDATLKEHAQAGIDYIQASRNPYGVWRYQPRDNDNDTSVTGWCACALQTAADFGLKVDRACLRATLVWIEGVTGSDGRSGYLKLGDPSSRLDRDHARRFPASAGEALTGITLNTRFLLGLRFTEVPIMEKQAAVLLARLPGWNVREGSIDLYYWFHASNALRQVGGESWRRWSAALHRALLPNQRKDGNFAGSWDPISVWGEIGGRVYSTAIATLCLEAESRYALLTTLTPLPKSDIFRSANQDWLAGQYERFSAGLASIEKTCDLTAQDKTAIDGARRALQAVVDEQSLEVRRLEKTSSFLNYPAAIERLETLRRRFGSLAAGEAAAAVLGKWQGDPKIQREITAAKRYRSIMKRMDGRLSDDQRDSLLVSLRGFVNQYGDTEAGRIAKARISSLR